MQVNYSELLFAPFFFNDTATTEIYTLSLHDALPISILPRIVALGDIDEDELAFSEEVEPGSIAPLDIPPKLGELERRLALARLVAAWAKSPDVSSLVVGGSASTLALAGDL